MHHHKRDSIEAHLSIVFAALAVTRWIEAQTSWSIRKSVRTARRYRTIEFRAGDHTVTGVADLNGGDDWLVPFPVHVVHDLRAGVEDGGADLAAEELPTRH